MSDTEAEKILESTEKQRQIFETQEEIETINIGDAEEAREIKVVKGVERDDILKACLEYKEVFAWTYNDMPGLDPAIATHKIPLEEGCTPIQQKLRRMRMEVQQKVREEIIKRLDAGFIRTVDYPKWVSNIVPVMKKDGNVRMCYDYRDLNKVSPKDNFPLPHIDMVIDNAARHARYSLVDGYSGYNQILMDIDDMEKTTFTTLWGTYCHTVMPFGLRNAGATYQRAMVTLFHDMMHKQVEVYVDDMVIKSTSTETHAEILRRVFQRLTKYQLRLNPAKCIFGASTGKLLGHIVSERGIEVDPDKVKAIQEMSPPRTETEVRSFIGRLNYIARFIANCSHICEPIFKLLRKDAPIEWNDQCQYAFDKIKTYLQNPPILVPPVLGKPLILYLTVLEFSFGAMLAQHDDQKKEKAIYYVSKKFTDGEAKYSPLEKSSCALAWVAFKLKQYMLRHTTYLVSRMDPIKYLMETPYIHGRLAKWQVMLSQYHIVYITKKSIKGSIIADQLAELPTETTDKVDFDFPDENLIAQIDSVKDQRWEMYFDGAVNSTGNGIGAVLISPDGEQVPIAIQLEFDCTNNVAEYEACVCGLQAALERGIKRLNVYGDSALIIYQINMEWKTRDPKLVPYQKYLTKLRSKFDEIEFQHLPRDKNPFADALATLASMIKLDEATTIRPLQISQ